MHFKSINKVLRRTVLMKYFCRPGDRKGTCYYEFQKGEFDETFWKDDSLLIHDDDWYDSGLEDFFFAEIPDLDEYGTTTVKREQWDEIREHASEYDEIVNEALAELDEWVKETFEEYDEFSILGL